MAMFQRDSESNHDSETIIGASVKVEGNFVGNGNVVVSGHVSGTLKTSKDLRVNGGAKIQADVEGANVFVAGEVRGNVIARESLTLTATARILGNVDTKQLTVESGAVLHGKVTMASRESATTPTTETPTPATEREANGRRR